MRQRVLFIVLFPVFCLTLDSYIEFRDVASAGEKGEVKIVETVAVEIKTLLGIEFYERYRDMKALSINEGLWNSDNQQSKKVLNNFIKVFPFYDIVLFVDPSGQPIAVNTINGKGKSINASKLLEESFSSKDWFKNVSSGNFTEDHEKGIKGVYFKDAYVDEHINDVLGLAPHLVTSFSTKVKNNKGELVGYLHGKANFDWVNKVILHVYHGMIEEGMSTAHISLFNKSNKLISDLDGHNAGTGNKEDLFLRDYQNGILKTHVSDFGTDFEKLTTTHVRDAQFTRNEKKDLDQVVAYAPVEDETFVNSIGWQVFVKVDKEELMGELLAAENRFIIGLTVVVIMSLLFALVVARIFTVSIERTVQTLLSGSQQLKSGVQQLSNGTMSLETTVHDQSSATEKTSSAATEIASMSEQNVTKVANAQDIGRDCTDASEKANQSTVQLKQSMNKVLESNRILEKSVNETLNEMEHLSESVNEIAQKTSLINDIVFQTKLLSFNASVEAARAGEQGKGFAVVAEEVGQLAASSGSAATEISSIVNGSLEKVSTIVKSSRDQLQKSLDQSEKVVKESYQSTVDVEDNLNLISQKIEELERVINDVSMASNEQKLGVSEINQALLQVTNGNRVVSKEVSSTKNFVQDFSSLVQDLQAEAISMEIFMSGKKKSDENNHQKDIDPSIEKKAS